ncbi:MAG TPA: hypothetical protein VHY35_17995 [Stellaceae bacterium]|jgi:hypothetical protein|nr:hypothetical protein [Stellaceae bacterium]
MIAIPKIVLIALVAFVVWYAMRWLNRPSPNVARRRPAARPQGAIEDLVACRVCGAYAAPGAGSCGKAGCPQLR